MARKKNEIAVKWLVSQGQGAGSSSERQAHSERPQQHPGRDRSCSKAWLPSLSGESHRFIGLATPKEAKQGHSTERTSLAEQCKEE